MRFGKTKKLHFVGIGGSGMSGIAEILLNMGYAVSGSDMAQSSATKWLQEKGCTVILGHDANNVGDADVVVISSVIRPSNPEVREARSRMIPVIPRAEMLAELMRMKSAVLVAGSHGKTTTTSMTAVALVNCGLDPTIIIGGRVDRFGSGAVLGEGEYLVAEADESDGSFLNLYPTIGVVTNIDEEHLDHYGSYEKVKDAFVTFINKTPFYGMSILCLDDPAIQEIMPRLTKRIVTYGITASADLTARDIEFNGLTSSFTAVVHGKELGQVSINMPGIHNVYNALAALMVGLELEIEPGKVIESLNGFAGIDRRLQVKGEANGVMVIDDYGHHPSEIKATLRALKEGFKDRRLLVAFQPHRYSRTRDLLGEFHKAFYDADELVVTEIYAASEAPIEGINGQLLAKGASDHGVKGVKFAPTLDDVVEELFAMAKEGDIVLTLGAGDIVTVGPKLLEKLKGNG